MKKLVGRKRINEIKWILLIFIKEMESDGIKSQNIIKLET